MVKKKGQKKKGIVDWGALRVNNEKGGRMSKKSKRNRLKKMEQLKEVSAKLPSSSSDSSESSGEKARKETQALEKKAKEKRRTVDLTNLSLLTTASDIVKFLKDAGSVVDYHFVYHENRGKLESKQCYVQMDSKKSAKKALSKDQNILLERTVNVKKSKCTVSDNRRRADDPCKVVVGRFYKSTKEKVEELVRKDLRVYGTIKSVAVHDFIPCSRDEKYLYALVEFEDSSSASEALKQQPMLGNNKLIQLG